jgi:preprotein translocase subunit Sss1
MRWLLAGLLASLAGPVWAESPQDFANRLRAANKALTVTVNVRDDKTTFGSLSIGVPPKVLEDREAVEKVLAEVGRFAKEERMRVTVVAAKPDLEAFVAMLKSAGAGAVSAQAMSDAASNKTARLFVLPGEPVKK